jgi:hypothetical protein
MVLVVVAVLAFASVELRTDPGLLHRLLSLISGINVNQVSPQSAKSLEYIKPDMVRLDGFPWDIIEARKGAPDYTVSDKTIQWAQDHALNVLGILQYAPGWANGQDFKTPPDLGMSNCGIPDLRNADTAFNTLRTYPPKNAKDFGTYASAVAKRYTDVTYWQIWNEPNNPIFWPSGPDASQYTRLLKAAYGKIKKANPRAQVVLGGISLNDLDYVDELYAAGARKYFDILAVHLYNPAQAPERYLSNELEKLHATMARNGDATKSIWLTEIGWYTGTGPDAVTGTQQSRYLEQLFTIAKSKPYVGAVFWNTLMDCSQGRDAANPEHNFGIFKNNFTPKPAASIMRGMMLKK